jgi:hypothetical protein
MGADNQVTQYRFYTKPKRHTRAAGMEKGIIRYDVKSILT